MRHRATTAELSASSEPIDKAILAERTRILGLLYSLRPHLAASVFGRFRTLVEAGEDLEEARKNCEAERPMMVDFPEGE